VTDVHNGCVSLVRISSSENIRSAIRLTLQWFLFLNLGIDVDVNGEADEHE
jgi:hypothetical protein